MFYHRVHLSKASEGCESVFVTPADYSLPGSSIHEILQVRILEWVAIPYSRARPDPGIEPRSPASQADSLPSEPYHKVGRRKSISLRLSVTETETRHWSRKKAFGASSQFFVQPKRDYQHLNLIISTP